MANLMLTALVTASNQVTYTTRDGVPYRGDDTNIVYVRPEHVAELLARGFTTATAANIPAGDPLQDDVGWAIAT